MNELISRQEDEWGIIKLQNCILNIAKYINDFCESRGIEYCLMGGSALGAVRHHGFIPWDDDLDVFMTPENYERFRGAFKEEGDQETFYLQEWGKDDKSGRISLAKLRMNKSTLIEKDLKDWDIHQGVYVDIFILHTCPNNKFSRMRQYVWAKYLVAKGAANRGYNKKKGVVGLGIKLLGLLPSRFFVNYALRRVYAYTGQSSNYFCHFLGRATLSTGLYKREYFLHTKKLPFETITLSVPECVEDYLRDRWGDYMKLPSREDIEKYHHSWKWSDTEAFPGYKSDNNYTEEYKLMA